MNANASDDLIAAALENTAVRKLYEEVEKSTPIAIKSVPNGNWCSSTTEGRTSITVAPTSSPTTALAHELLHAKLKIEGYRQYLSAVSMDTAREGLPGLLEILDNELQHHRMFPLFVAAGLDPQRFYHDDDVDAFKYVREALGKMGKDSAIEDFFRLFVTVIAPGGSYGEQEREDLKELFRRRCRRQAWKILIKCEAAIKDWAASQSSDPGPTIVEILRLFGKYNWSWVGYDATLDKGLFIGETFTTEQAQAWLAHRNG